MLGVETISTTKEKKDKKAENKVNNEKHEEKSKKNTISKEKLEEEISTLKEQYARLQAEFANYKRRTEEEKQSAIDLGVSKTLKQFIDVFDDFELAIKNKTDNLEDYKKGMELLFAKLITHAEELGLKKIKTVGEQFNPSLHEALLAEKSNKPEQEILEELQSGYLFKERPLRTAKVKVAKK